MRYLSVCSGIEAATCAWHQLGWTPVGFSEVEKFPSAVLAHHYPGVPNFGDMTKFEEWPDDLAPDVLVGGTPCQSFSVAGLRKGLDDPRGNLMLTFGSIARRYRPEWLVWENVPGVLSSNGGRDFGTFLGMLAELGYGFAYRVLDAQYFGVAQRRRRVFVVGHLGDWRRAAAVLFERESLSGNPAPSREPRQVAPTIPSRSTGGGGLGTDFDCDGGLIRDWPAEVACTLNAAFGDKQGLEDQNALSGASLFVPAVCGTLTARSVTSLGAPEVDGGMYLPVTASAITASMGNGCLGHNKDENVLALPGAKQQTYMKQGMAVRRLTPRECERLQGFPDDHTAIPWRGKSASECPDGPRYKALGNSMAVPCMRWLADRIEMVRAIDAKREAA